MRLVKDPTYKQYVTGEIERFDDRNTAFSRGAVEGNKYTAMHEQCLENIAKARPGKTLLDHATWVSGATVDYVVRRNLLGRETKPIYNTRYQFKNPDPVALTKIIKEKALWIGADMVGVAELDPSWVYTHWGDQNVRYSGAAEAGDPIEIPAEFNRVIVMIHEMDYEVIRRSPAIEYDTDIGYSRGAWCASSLAMFVAELGFRAIPSVNELGINIAMAVDAGLGEMGRNGMLITREYGPRVRISKVFTTLPLVPDTPIDIGVQRFCQECKLCAKYCPSRALMLGDRTDEAWDRHNVPGMLKWPIRAMDCLDWWVKNGNHCSVCLRVCPWNKPNSPFHGAVRILAERNILTGFLVSMDRVFGYGKQVIEKPQPQDPAVVRV